MPTNGRSNLRQLDLMLTRERIVMTFLIPLLTFDGYEIFIFFLKGLAQGHVSVTEHRLRTSKRHFYRHGPYFGVKFTC